MEKLCWKGGALLAPMPAVMVSCGSPEHPNVMTVAWTGIVNTQPAKTYISLRKSRYSYDMIKNSGEFVINLTPSSLVRVCDFCGVRSGREVDKFAACGLTPVAGFSVQAPLIAQCPVNLECRVTDIVEMGSHDMFLADILSVAVDASLVDAAGRLCMEKAGLLAYVHGSYHTLGKKIGQFGFSVKKGSRNGKMPSAPPADRAGKPATGKGTSGEGTPGKDVRGRNIPGKNTQGENTHGKSAVFRGKKPFSPAEKTGRRKKDN